MKRAKTETIIDATQGHARTPELDALLHKVCIDDPYGSYLSSPFGINICGARWDVATDGKLMLALPNGVLDLREPLSKQAAFIVGGAPMPTHTCSMPTLREWAGTDDGICPACGGHGITGSATCQKCAGDGVIYCNLGHEHNCPDCDGASTKGTDCAACNGREGREIIPGTVGECIVNRFLLASVIHDLPGDVVQVGWSASGRPDVVAIYGPDWRLIVAALQVVGGLTVDCGAPLDLASIEGAAP